MGTILAVLSRRCPCLRRRGLSRRGERGSSDEEAAPLLKRNINQRKGNPSGKNQSTNKPPKMDTKKPDEKNQDEKKAPAGGKGKMKTSGGMKTSVRPEVVKKPKMKESVGPAELKSKGVKFNEDPEIR
jgi:hypothetical protein